MGEINMNVHYQRMVLCLIIASATSILLEGCGNRHEGTSPLSSTIVGTEIDDGISTTMGNKIDDSIVTTKVKWGLLADANVKSFEIGVITHKGEVQLSGFVDNQSEIDRAMEIASGINGVQNVGNEMSVRK
jgi:hyperosmotically inducible protein